MELKMELSARQKKWDKRYLQLAEFVAQWSKDPSTKTGAVLVSPKNFVVAVGYNGFPRGVQDTEFRLNDRETKYKIIVHNERNVIISAAQNLTSFTMYGWPFMPCASCAGMIIQAGISRVVAHKNDNPRWQTDFKLTQEIFSEAGVTLDLYEKDPE